MSESLGLATEIWSKRDAILASNPRLGLDAKARILGKPVYRGPCTTTYIKIDLRTGERCIRRVLDEAAFAREVQKAANELVKKMRDVKANRLLVNVAHADEANNPNAIQIRQILAGISTATNYTVAELCGPRRDRPLARARQIAYYAIRLLRPDLSLPAIGRALGLRDHTTVMHGLRVFETNRFAQPTKAWLAHPAVAALIEKVPA